MKTALLAAFAAAAVSAWQGPVPSHLASGDFRGALIQLNTIPPDKRDAQWHMLASKAEDGLNDAAKAVDEAQQAIDLDPHSEPARLQLAQIFLTRNTPEAAYEIFSEALPLFPDSALIRLGAGLALNQLRRYGEAIPILKDCLRLNPNLGPAFDALGAAYLNSGDYETLLREAADYSRIHPDDFRGPYYEASARVELSMDNAGSETLLRRSIELNPEFAAAHTLLGRVLLNLSRVDEAIPELAKAIRLRPGYAPAHLYLAAAYRKTGKPDLAREESREVARLNEEENRPAPHLLYHRGSRPASQSTTGQK
jgi:tetratricopeptide (TPR) repeat protein